MATDQVSRRLRRGSRKMQYLMDQYAMANPNEGPEIKPELVAEWACAQKLWKPIPVKPQEQLRRLICRSLRDTYMTDPQGREVRANLPILEEVMTADGPKRRSRWYPMFEAPSNVARASFSLRRRSALADAVQLHFDWMSYNDNNVLGEELEPLDLNFEKDIAELSQPTTYPNDPGYDLDAEFEDVDEDEEDEDI